jgi:threonyl-tRNA synthetase
VIIRDLPFFLRFAMQDEQVSHLRHSLAHLLAAAVLELYPDTKRAIGPAIEEGFYYDFEFATPLPESALPVIEQKMREILKTWSTFERREVSAHEARTLFDGNPYKLELIEEFAKGEQMLTTYTSGTYVDLCRGGHVEDARTIDPKCFTLDRVAGAYWRGDEHNTMLTRVYGLAFATRDELVAYKVMLVEAAKRDHRKLGQELDLFAFSPLVGPGLPLFTPRGTVMRKLLEEFVWDLMRPYGYDRVTIPHMAKVDLYKTSGHWDKFQDDIFHITSKKTEDLFIMKPMNCPHHTQIYASRPRSYRDLPLRYSEVTAVYRDENTGQLAGLSRVRSITQDDAHIFCRVDQIEQEVESVYQIVTKFYETFGMSLRIRLSLHDAAKPEKYLGSAALWEQSVGMLRSVLEAKGKEYETGIGEAAFYGPKIDFMAKDAIGREWQLATVQLDFNQPERFGLEYAAADGTKQRPVMVHRAISGSLERFMGVIIEHYAGAFPVWLAPVQVLLLPVGEGHRSTASEIAAQMNTSGIRVDIDLSDETVGKKIRAAEKSKVPYMVVIGDKEVAGELWQIRRHGVADQFTLTREAFVEQVMKESKERSS